MWQLWLIHIRKGKRITFLWVDLNITEYQSVFISSAACHICWSNYWKTIILNQTISFSFGSQCNEFGLWMKWKWDDDIYSSNLIFDVIFGIMIVKWQERKKPDIIMSLLAYSNIFNWRCTNNGMVGICARAKKKRRKCSIRNGTLSVHYQQYK